MATDPLLPEPLPVWDGPWPPDPSWDEPALPPAIAEVPAEVPADWNASPVPDVAFAPPPAPMPVQPPMGEPPDADLIELEPNLPPVAEVAPPADPAPWDADQIELDTGLEDTAPATEPAPWDADLIEVDEPAAEPVTFTDEERVAALAELDPVSFARLQATQQLAADEEAAAKRVTAARADREAAEANERMRRVAVARTQKRAAELDAESDRLAQERVDPDGWRESRSLFQTIAMYTAGIVGGLVQSRQGGPNPGMQMINAAIEQHIDAQKANLANRQNSLARRQAANVDAAAADEQAAQQAEAFRMAAWKRAVDDIETERLQYNPTGTRALKLAAVARDARAQLAAAQEAYSEKMLKREIEIGEYDLKVAAHNETVKKNAAARAGAGSGGGSSSKRKYSPEELAIVFPGAPVPPPGMPPMTVSEYAQWAEAARKGRGLTEPTEREKDERDLAIGGPKGKLRDATGKVFLPPKDEATKLRKQMAAATLVVDIIDEIESIRDRVGGESEWGNSPERQRLDVLQNQLIILQKSGTEGMSSDEDMKKLAAAVGAADVASFRSRAAGLKQGRISTVANLNAELKARNYDGEPIRFPDTRKAAAKTPDEAKAEGLIKSTTGEKKQSIPTGAIAVAPFIAGPARLGEALLRSESTELGDGPERQQLNTWAAVANDPAADETARRSAMAQLLTVADKSRSPAVRTAAKRLLMYEIRNPPAPAAAAPEGDE